MSGLSSVDHAIILTLNFYQGKYNKKYSFPSQNTLLSNLKVFHKIEISKRTLNYHLKKLEDNYFIYRVRRISKNTAGCMTFNSTLYSLAKKSYLFLSRLFNNLKDGFYSIKKYLHRSYISSIKEREEDQHFLSADENIRRLRELGAKL
ncbi:hypothetical protein ES703_91497 [subsurface metagenome]